MISGEGEGEEEGMPEVSFEATSHVKAGFSVARS